MSRQRYVEIHHSSLYFVFVTYYAIGLPYTLTDGLPVLFQIFSCDFYIFSFGLSCAACAYSDFLVSVSVYGNTSIKARYTFLSVWLAQLVKAPTLSQRACMFIRA